MRETVYFTDKQKAIIGVIVKQFEKKHAMGLTLYDPIDACNQLSETGELTELELDIPEQFKVLNELSTMDLDIQIYISKNDLNPETNCLTDGMRNTICLNEDSDELEQEMFDIRFTFGSAYILGDVKGIRKVKAMCEEGYRAILKFVDDCNYRIECSRRDFKKIYNFSTLHAGKRPQLILKCALDHKDDEDPTVSKKTLNDEVLKKSTSLAPIIGSKESISSSVFDVATIATLSYFFDFGTQSIRFKGYIRDDLTGADIDVFEQYCINKSI